MIAFSCYFFPQNHNLPKTMSFSSASTQHAWSSIWLAGITAAVRSTRSRWSTGQWTLHHGSQCSVALYPRATCCMTCRRARGTSCRCGWATARVQLRRGCCLQRWMWMAVSVFTKHTHLPSGRAASMLKCFMFIPTNIAYITNKWDKDYRYWVWIKFYSGNAVASKQIVWVNWTFIPKQCTKCDG